MPIKERSRFLFYTLLSLVALCSGDLPPASACMVVSREPVVVEGEEALIVWDAAHQREYFIRRADFFGARRSFGFLVPTPAKPELSEVEETVFTRLAELYSAPAWAKGGVGGGGLRSAGEGRGRALVQVVERKRVAGLDATVLSASDPRALTAWLRKHRYPAPQGSSEWLRPYIERGWFLTAFRYRPASGAARFGSRGVMMSFATARPFFPYSEPKGARRGENRSFRVTVVSDKKVKALLGDKPWDAPLKFAEDTLAIHSVLPHSLPAEALPYRPWVTTFDESQSTRGALDLYFEPASDMQRVPPSVETRVGTRPQPKRLLR